MLDQLLGGLNHGVKSPAPQEIDPSSLPMRADHRLQPAQPALIDDEEPFELNLIAARWWPAQESHQAFFRQ